MDIFDEVDLESSQMDDQPPLRMLPSKIQDPAAGANNRTLKVLRCKMDEVPLGADSGECTVCPQMLHYCNAGFFSAGAAFAHAATMSSFAGMDEQHAAAKVPESSGSSRRCVS